MNQITNVFIHGRYTVGIFIDLYWTFDTVNHNILLEKLKAKEFNLKTWNGLEAICQIENSLFRATIQKQK